MIAASLLLGWGLLLAQVPPTATPPEVAPTDPLEEIRALVLDLEFEAALAALRSRLDGGASDPSRADALALRAEIHVSLGNLDAAERDYRELLGLRPRFRPDPTRTPEKVLERFERIREASVGSVRIATVPEGAALRIDGELATPDAEGRFVLPAGERTLRAEADGFDPLETRFDVKAGGDGELSFRLVPNARTVIVQTSVPGVRVELDGEPVGITRAASAASAGELTLPQLSPGEHAFAFTKECHREVRFTRFVTVDLVNLEPERIGVVRMEPQRARLAVSGPAGGRVLLDGREAAVLPMEPAAMCPGTRTLEVQYGERRAWVSREALEDGRTTRVEARPRPNVAIAGSEGWPPELAPAAGRFNLVATGLRAPDDPADVAAWGALRLADDIDWVLARDAAGGWHSYSPVLGVAGPLASGRLDLRPPERTRPVWGLRTADSEVGGPVRVVLVDRSGAAARAGIRVGDAVLEVGGAPVARSRALRAILERASPETPLAIAWSRGGKRIEAEMRAGTSPVWEPGPDDPARDTLRAAWARAGSLPGEDDAELALAELALLQAKHGRFAEAAELWRRLRLGTSGGIGPGTVAYYLGVSLERSGRLDEAAAAFRRAADSDATAFDAEGPRVAPAARDHLVELGGVSARRERDPRAGG